VKKLRLVISEAAALDILEQAQWYKQQAGEPLAKRSEREATSSLMRTVENPHRGSPCHFKSEELHDIRRVPIADSQSILIFYRIQARELLVLRVVHGARDLEKLLK